MYLYDRPVGQVGRVGEVRVGGGFGLDEDYEADDGDEADAVCWQKKGRVSKWVR